MQRRISNWWLILFWIPAVALAVGLVAGCATTSPGSEAAPVQPSHEELQRLVAEELDADTRFDSFAAANSDARQVADQFRPELADVNAIDCRAGPGGSVDCTLEVVMRFPGMHGRESRTYWERRLRHVGKDWQLVGLAQP